MKRKLALLALVAVTTFVGCKGKTGPEGPAGSTGSSGTGIQDVTVSFKENVLPYTGWTGTLFHWVDAANPTTAPVTGEIRLNTGATLSNFSRGLLKFTISGVVPSNATISAAVLQLTTKTTTSLASGSYAIGVHSVVTTCPWDINATWNDYNGGADWGFCASNTSALPITRGVSYSDTPSGSVSIASSTVNGNSVLLAWNLDKSVVQNWVKNPTQNNGVVLCYETETGLSSGFISFYDNGGTSEQKPTLILDYYIP